MLSSSDTHLQQENQRKQPDIDPSSHPHPNPLAELNQSQYFNRTSPTETPYSDSGRSMSSSSSGEIMSTPFDLGSQRFEYPFPQTQGSPTEAYLPLSSSITAPSHGPLPPWQTHMAKTFPLTQPPLSRVNAHPKLRSASVREPPVPPGLVKRRSRIAGLQRQSSEEPSDKSDVSDEIARTRRPSRFRLSLIEAVPRTSIHSNDMTQRMSDVVPVKQASSLPIGSFDRPSVEGPAGSAINSGQSEGTPRPSVLHVEREIVHVREERRSFAVYCWIVASQLLRWILHILGFSRV